jgi:hypothetical protein
VASSGSSPGIHLVRRNRTFYSVNHLVVVHTKQPSHALDDATVC